MTVKALLVVLVLTGLMGAEAGVARAVGAMAIQSSNALDHGDFAEAAAIDRAVAQRAGPLSLLAGGTVSAARPAAESARLLAAADAAHNRGDDLTALARLDELVTGHPSRAVTAWVAAARPGYDVGAAAQLIDAGSGNDAVALLDQATSMSGSVTARVIALLPDALLLAARESIAHTEYPTAVATLHRLVERFPGSAAAANAGELLAGAEPVIGTLVHRDGAPAGGNVRLSRNFRRVGDSYATSGPFYTANADASGDFRFSRVPVGGPYVLEELQPGGWTTLIDPATGGPANPVTVTPLTPADLAFIVLP